MHYVLACVLGLIGAQAPAALTLEIRVFLEAEEVTSATRVTVHRAGDRTTAIAAAEAGEGRRVFPVPAGIYDAQVVREQDGKVVNIRWAERLVVMPYPDEGGRHLEVINFASGYGALQIRSARPDGVPETALFAVGERAKPAASAATARGDDEYTLFVAPAGRYDLQVRGAKTAWHPDVEIPLDRTRLWVVP